MSSIKPNFLSQDSRQIQSSLIRDLLHLAGQPGIISLAAGMPSIELLDVEGIASATEDALTSGAHVLQYSVSEGQFNLRQQLVELAAQRGKAVTAVTPERIIVTHGSQQALDLLARALLNPGECVITENATYIAALQVFRLRGAVIMGVSADEQGLCTQALENIKSDGKLIKVLYVVPNFANPSGATLSLPRRYELVQWAVKNQVLVIEDDPYGELRFEGESLPSLYDIAQQIPGAVDWVCYVSSLSKIISPALRLGWVCAPEWLRPTLIRLKQVADLQTSTFTQEVAACYLASNRLAARIETMKQIYSTRRNALCDALTQNFGDLISFVIPLGGMFLWAKINVPDFDTHAKLNKAVEAGVVYVPGEAFQAHQRVCNSLRLNFTHAPPETLRDGAARLKIAWRL